MATILKSASAALKKMILGIVGVAVIWLVLDNWSFVFSRIIRGEIMEVARVTQPTAVIGSQITAEQLFSFAILVRSESGEIFSASSEDRQWAIVHKGFCVETRIFPYPPWSMEKSGTFFNARLVKVLDCPRAAGIAPGTAAGAIAAATPVPSPSPTPSSEH